MSLSLDWSEGQIRQTDRTLLLRRKDELTDKIPYLYWAFEMIV